MHVGTTFGGCYPGRLATTIFRATQLGLQYWNNVVTIQNNVATMLQHCVALKNRRCELSGVTSS